VQVEAIAVVVAGYFLGSIDFGVILPRLRGVDIYAEGSGNPGATNVLRSMGRRMAALVMAGDLLKGLAAAAIGDLVVGEAAGFAAGFAAVVGHCFPVWHRFRGGKGVAAAGGAVLWLEPLSGLASVGIWLVVILVAKRASVASMVTAACLVPLVALFGHRGWSLVWAAAISLLIVARHRGNIVRLIKGAEHRLEEAG
jgi:glycerol-3-phosphate acyltransferase PlsY